MASVSHLMNHGYMTLLPALFVVIAGEQSLGFLSLGALANVGYFLFGMGSIPAGVLVDRFGSRRLLVFCLWGMAVASILTGLATNAILFAGGHALLGLAASLYHPAGLSLIAKHVPKRGKALGLHGVLGNVGLSGAPMFAGGMVWLFDTWRAAYLAFGALGLVVALVVQTVRLPAEEQVAPPAEPAAESQRRARPTIPAALLLLYGGSILFGFIYRGALTYFPALLKDEVRIVAESEFPVVAAGALASAVLATGMLGQWLGGYLTDRLERPVFAQIGSFLILAPTAYLISRLVDAPLLIAGVGFSIALYAWQPVQNGLIAGFTTRRSHGRGYGVNFFLIMGIGSVATTVGGFVAQWHGVAAFYALLGVVAVAAAGVGGAVIWAARAGIELPVIWWRRADAGTLEGTSR